MNNIFYKTKPIDMNTPSTDVFEDQTVWDCSDR